MGMVFIIQVEKNTHVASEIRTVCHVATTHCHIQVSFVFCCFPVLCFILMRTHMNVCCLGLCCSPPTHPSIISLSASLLDIQSELFNVISQVKHYIERKVSY